MKFVSEESSEYYKKFVDTISKIGLKELTKAIYRLMKARNLKQNVFIIGNGGSATTAMHFASDLNKGAYNENAPRFKAQCLAYNIAELTALSNDHGYEYSFVDQLLNKIEKNDVLVVFSCSGTSLNVVMAANYARTKGASVITFTGKYGGNMISESDILISIDCDDIRIIEDTHLMLEHFIIGYIKKWGDYAVFVDRDGTLCKEVLPYLTEVENVEIFPEAAQFVAQMNKDNVPVIMISNQSAVGRGLITERQMNNVNLEVYIQLLKSCHAKIDDEFVCIHNPEENCSCRKPATGLIDMAVDRYGFNLGKSFMIGNSKADEDLAKNAGLHYYQIDKPEDWTTIKNNFSSIQKVVNDEKIGK